MATAAIPRFKSAPRPVAPWWHTGLLIAFFVLMAAGGAALQYRVRARAALVDQRPHVAFLYVALIAAEWSLVYYVWKGGLRRAGIPLRQFVGGRWASYQAVLGDALLAFVTWMLWKGMTFCWVLWLGRGHAASISPLIPHGVGEAVLWVLLSISAAISEELVFRGYLQHQLTAFTGRASLALFLQAALFGIAHGYQGVQSCLAIVLYGALLTVLALWRESLRPGMIAHAWTDIAGGLLS